MHDVVVAGASPTGLEQRGRGLLLDHGAGLGDEQPALDQRLQAEFRGR